MQQLLVGTINAAYFGVEDFCVCNQGCAMDLLLYLRKIVSSQGRVGDRLVLVNTVLEHRYYVLSLQQSY